MERELPFSGHDLVRFSQHASRCPALQIEDALKFLHQSAFGCEHAVTDESAARASVVREYESFEDSGLPRVEPLDGDYCRVSLSWLEDGLSPDTLARIFFLSAKKEEGGRARLLELLAELRALTRQGVFPFEAKALEEALARWETQNFCALHHSDAFRAAYRPAYRVVARRFAEILPVLCEIDCRLRQGALVMRIEGGAASGKTTLAQTLSRVYDCNVFCMDDFFLRPEQRTPERLGEVGGNVDYERFEAEVLRALKEVRTVRYRPFDCSTMTLGETVTAKPSRLTVVEGAYSMHPRFGDYAGLSVFLDVEKNCQKQRIRRRNTAEFAARFFSEWIPKEDAYFAAMDPKGRADLILSVTKNGR
ncbi:MAG: hypothetical protein II328_03020 [Clostridia bacterium]|nr:hypothetical protein [Clostridia bacterium]